MGNITLIGKRGRKPGIPGKSRLDPHKKKIFKMLNRGDSRKEIAKKMKVNPSTLWRWFQKVGRV